MKKALSVILAATLMTSGLALSGVSAAAAEKEEQPVYLLGDVNLDGILSIADATDLQRDLAGLLELSDLQTRASMVDGEDLSIQTVTYIQRYLDEFDTGLPIGKPLNEAYNTKAFPVLRESLDSQETAEVRCYADQPNVPYMSVTDFYNTFYLIGTDLTEGMTFTRSGDKYTLTNIAGTSATYDISEDTLYTANFENYTTTAVSLQNAAAGGMDDNYPFIKVSDTNEPSEATPLTLSLGEYGIDLRGDETGVYAPVATLSDMFATPEGYYVVCAGGKLYTKEYSGAHQASAALDTDPDYLAAIQEDHPADLADFTYRELCFNLDLWYGQPGQEWVHDDLKTDKIDELLTKKYPDIKANLQSGNFKTFYNGLFYLINGLLFDGGHTTVFSRLTNENVPLFIETAQSLAKEEYAGKFIYSLGQKQRDMTVRTKARNAAYGEDYYIEQGDTAMIHFDSFVVDYNGWKAFYAGTGERPLAFESAEGTKYDTVGVVLSGLERAKQNPAIKNIIIDMSCNGGGDSGAMNAIEWLMTGQGYTRSESRLTGRTKTSAIQFDMNFDGVFDENDVSPYTDYNYGVLTRSYAFSCGNAYPWFMHEHGAMILGQKTGGGACCIRFSSVAGIEIASSSCSGKIVADSGESVDFGCPIDADLISEGENPYENFYNLSILSEKMNEFYGS